MAANCGNGEDFDEWPWSSIPNTAVSHMSPPMSLQYVVQTVEVESGKMKAALSQAEEQTLYLQEQLDRHNRTLHEMKKQLQHEQQEAAKLRAQVSIMCLALTPS